ncbi:MAG: sodium:solute symporter family protein [Elusimicrobiota bacterium]|jgi:SSS family solute:Na+ symporter|nr:sodium:solute symporter family protein [Elusimicrobiota bacterium]
MRAAFFVIMQTFNPNLNVLAALGAWDIVVFALVLLLTLCAVIYGQLRRKKGANKFLDYMLMGRRLSLPLFVATLAATWYGGIFGVNEITFNFGIYNFITQGVFWYAAYIIFALFLVDKIKKYQSVTMPQLAREMFGKKSSYAAAVLTFFGIMPISYVLSLGIFLHLVFGIGVVKGMIAGTAFVCLYAARGGLRAVVFSDVVQFFVMCAAVFLVLAFSVGAFGGIGFLKANLPASHFSLTGGNTWFNTLAWGFIALSTLVDPSFYQRCFAAQDAKTAKYGILICTLIWFCFDICTTGGALYARALMPQAQPAHAYFLYALQLLPEGLRGFFVAGVLALILSTLDSFLFIASNTLGYDLLKGKFKDKVLANQIFFFAVAAVSVVLAVFFEGNFRRIWFVAGSYMSACLLIPMVFGHLWPRRISDNAFTFSCVLSAAAITLWNILPKPAALNAVEGFYIGVICNIIILGFAVFKNKTYAKN